MPGTRLQPSDREFFDALDRVVYGNPFSDEREQLVQRLAPGPSGQQIGPDHEALTRKVEPMLRPYADADNLPRLDAEDRRIVQTAFLYVCCHPHVPQLDDLISRAVSEAEMPPADRVARSVIGELARCGLDEAAGARFFAFFYQLR